MNPPWTGEFFVLPYPDAPLRRLAEMRGFDADDPDDREWLEDEHGDWLRAQREAMGVPHPHPLARYRRTP